MSLVIRTLLILTLLVVSGCATSVQDSEPVIADILPATQSVAAESEPVEYGSFTRDQLTQAILSELGGQRGEMTSATQNYYQLARETRDAGIIRRALQFASATGETAIVVELAQMWSSITPDSIEPQLLLGYQFLEAGRLDEALVHMSRVMELGGNVDFTALSARTQDIPAQQRRDLHNKIAVLLQSYPQESSLHFALVQLLDQDGDTRAALAELENLKEAYGVSSRTYLIEAQLLHEIGQVDEALTLFREGVERFPDNRLLRFTFAQMLVRENELRSAREQFTTLVRQQPDDFETLYSLALLNLEMQELENARSIFNRMLDVGYRNNESHFYLGYINEVQGEASAAIGQYRQVQMDSSNFLNAQRQVVRLLIAQGRYADAHQWAVRLSDGQPRLEALFTNIEAEALLAVNQNDLAEQLLNDIIARYPENTDLLFTRTLMHERNGNMAAAEADLRAIIALQPNDARALNHLGYTLADRTDRHEEALHLIERAIAVEPDDPAIIDSLGWVQFKLGRYEEALANLSRALALFPDHEVAAHLGEVLWVMGRKDEAIEVWDTALEQRPDSELLRDVIDRLNPDADS